MICVPGSTDVCDVEILAVASFDMVCVTGAGLVTTDTENDLCTLNQTYCSFHTSLLKAVWR